MRKITLDFETRSKCDLLTAGSYKYSQDPSTEILMLAFVLADGDPDEPHIWYNTDITGVPNTKEDQEAFEELMGKVCQGAALEAHNAGFEIDIWNNVAGPKLHWPIPRLHQWYCSAAKAAYHSLPRSLDGLGQALGIKDKQGRLVCKDKEGHDLMIKLSSPHPTTGEWLGDTTDFLREGAYCKTDVRTEWYCSEALPDLPEEERAIWLLDWEINNRGVLINKDMVKEAVKAADFFMEEFLAQLPILTNGAVERPTQRQRIKNWAKEQGVDLPNTQAKTIAKVLKKEVPPLVKQVLDILVQGTRTSMAKYRAMLLAVCLDDRIRGMLLYYGATTGRWTGRGVQPHNFPRGSLKAKEMLLAIADILAGYEWLCALYPDVGKLLSDALRGAFMAPKGKKFAVADFAAVEARVTAWLSGQEDLLELFRNNGLVYEDMAEQIYHHPVNKDEHPKERFIGKQAILGLGFQMGWKKFRDTLKDTYDTYVTADFARHVVRVYRQKNTKIVEMWDALEQAAIQAVRTGKPVTCGALTWYTKRLKAGMFLMCRLPSGRSLSYPFPMLKKTKAYYFTVQEKLIDPEGNIVNNDVSVRVSVQLCEQSDILAIREIKRIAQDQEYYLDLKALTGQLKGSESVQLTFMGTDAKTKQWVRQDTYGGKLMENVVQGTARDFLATAMIRVEASGKYAIIMSVHDEIITETVQGSAKELEKLMNEVPFWGLGCPIASEAWEGPVYRK